MNEIIKLHTDPEVKLIENKKEVTIMDLPEEIRGLIYNLIPQKEAMKFRLVCHKWSEEVNNLYNYYDVHLKNQIGSKNIKRVLQLRTTKCQVNVTNFQQQPLRSINPRSVQRQGVDLKVNPGPDLDTYPPIKFKYPNLLQDLTIMSISPVDLDNLLNSAQNLQELYLNLNFRLMNHKFSRKNTNAFNHLKKLSILITFMDPETSAVDLNAKISKDNLLEQLLPSISIPNLVTFNFFLEVNTNCNPSNYCNGIFSIVYHFIARHWKSLKFLDIGFNDYKDRELISPCVKEIIKLDHSGLLDSLTSLTMYSNSKLFVAHDIWQKILRNQKKLSNLEMKMKGIPAIDAILYAKIIQRNATTLTSINLIAFDFGQDNDRPFDLSIFQDCLQLKSLHFDGEFGKRIIPGLPELINVSLLPRSIEILSIEYLLVLTDEIMDFLNLNSGGTLKRLVIDNCGLHGDFGVNASVMEIIMQDFSHLKSFKIVDFNETNEIQRALLFSNIILFSIRRCKLYRHLGKLKCVEFDFEWPIEPSTEPEVLFDMDLFESIL